MEEVGKVLKIKGNTAEILIERNPSCESCGACRLISDKEMVAEAENTLGAKEGQLVKISLEDKKVLEASIIIYAIPLVFFILGYFVGILINNLLFPDNPSEIIGIIFAFVFLAISYLIINRFFGTKSKGAEVFQPVIKEIIKAPEQES
jgi:sigma-E factor negative regulatory protein RseC